MHKDWQAMAGELSSAIKEVRLGSPEVTKAFSAMAKAATEAGVLDTKTKELIALAISVAIRCDGCVACGPSLKSPKRNGRARWPPTHSSRTGLMPTCSSCACSPRAFCRTRNFMVRWASRSPTRWR